MKEDYVILGLDPGSIAMGWAVIGPPKKNPGGQVSYSLAQYVPMPNYKAAGFVRPWCLYGCGIIKAKNPKQNAKRKSPASAMTPLEQWGAALEKNNSRPELSQRLWHIFTTLQDIITIYAPKYLALESLFITPKFPASILPLAYSRAIPLLLAGMKDIAIKEVSPTEVKKILTGAGKGGKIPVIQAIKDIFHITLPSDAADAVALALVHSLTISPIAHGG